MKAFFVIALFSIVSVAQSALAENRINNSNCTYQIYPNSFGLGLDQIKILDKGRGSVTLHFNPNNDEFTGAGICNDHIWGRKDDISPVQSLKTTDGNQVTYTFRCGGNLYVSDYFVKVTFEKGSDNIISAFSNSYIAKWSLPNGAHSGPLKNESDLTSCNSGETTWKTIVKELKDAGK